MGPHSSTQVMAIGPIIDQMAPCWMTPAMCHANTCFMGGYKVIRTLELGVRLDKWMSRCIDRTKEVSRKGIMMQSWVRMILLLAFALFIVSELASPRDCQGSIDARVTSKTIRLHLLALCMSLHRICVIQG